LLLLLFSGFSALLQAQQKFTLSGYVSDSASSESISGAVVSLQSAGVRSDGVSVATNSYGFFSITLNKGN